ncbi:hypothetical protein C3489_34065 [Streptomyces sp. Ru71]|uniref:hypothetical protein n=1 Tax=Streptomyces sp. Ru71 TaxID=2080746 RepID=UPI000CDD90B3|nr:hypothetical protein [Streptomyces sp. Ru71]POX45512.1 hypothetical protein C3489_34065 [Streptomyces sp. Ru71]
MKRKSFHRTSALGTVAGLGLALSVLPIAPAHAQTFVPCGNVTALRNAINTSNTTNENITLAPFCTYTVTGTALPTVTGSYSVSGFNTTVARDAGTANFRVFSVASGGDLTLNSIHVRGGNLPAGEGGGIQVSGPGSTLVVQGGSVRNNNAGNGGGIAVRDLASARLNSTLISDNHASGLGGGVSHDGTTLQVNNTRITGNSADLRGGGLHTHGPVAAPPATATLSASQVTANSATDGGGIYEGTNSQVTLAFTGVTNNTPNNCRPVGAVPGCAN